MGSVDLVASPSFITNEHGLSALCRALAPAQVQVTYCAGVPRPFRVAWQSEQGPVSFSGTTPDDAAEKAHAALRGRSLAQTVARTAAEPTDQAGWAEAMRERIQQIEDRGVVRRPVLRLVRSTSSR